MNIHFRVPAARAGRRGTTPAPARPRNPGAGQLRARPAAAPQLRPSSQLQLWPGAWRGSWARPARRAPAPSTSPPRRSTASTTPPRWVPDLADSYTECTELGTLDRRQIVAACWTLICCQLPGAGLVRCSLAPVCVGCAIIPVSGPRQSDLGVFKSAN